MCVTWSWRTCILAFGFAPKSGCDRRWKCETVVARDPWGCWWGGDGDDAWWSARWRWWWLSADDVTPTWRAVVWEKWGSGVLLHSFVWFLSTYRLYTSMSHHHPSNYLFISCTNFFTNNIYAYNLWIFMSITLQNYQSRIHGGSINLKQFSINQMSMFPCLIPFKKECSLTIIYFSDFKVNLKKFL
jgi:hypothetical protein